MKTASGLALAALACLGVGCARWADPKQGFDRAAVPAAPDYRLESAWAALPQRRDDADAAPIGMRNGQQAAGVDVFFIHPTTYVSRRGWNQPLGEEQADRGTEYSLRAQASAFNGSGRVYAPFYRQVSRSGHASALQADRDRAMDLAYGDVRAAFEVFLQWSQGRPFAIAGHGQGSEHGLRLLSERVSARGSEPALRKRLVAAYLIGAALPAEDLAQALPGLPLCASASQTGCVVAYNTIQAGAHEPGERPERFEQVRAWAPGGYRSWDRPRLACVNPVSWSVDGRPSPASAHRGALHAERDRPLSGPHPARASARCDQDGLLATTLPQGEWAGWWFGDEHSVNDYQLFYMDLRGNFGERAAAWQRARGAERVGSKAAGRSGKAKAKPRRKGAGGKH